MKYLPRIGGLLKKLRMETRITLTTPENGFPTFVESVKVWFLPWYLPVRDVSAELKTTHKKYLAAQRSAASYKSMMEIQAKTLEEIINTHGLVATQAIQSEKDCGVFKVIPSKDKVCKIALQNDLQLLIQDKGKESVVIARRTVQTVKQGPRNNNNNQKQKGNQQNQNQGN